MQLRGHRAPRGADVGTSDGDLRGHLEEDVGCNLMQDSVTE